MKISNLRVLVIAFFLLNSCSTKNTSVNSIVTNEENILGKPEYLQSPYITAGDRLYSVGYQDGSFPELGWHIPDEMGGIWDHPVKLMDGFDAALIIDGESFALNLADTFLNYPFANQHRFKIETKQLQVYRTQFVPDHLEGMVVEYEFFNRGKDQVDADFRFSGSVDLRPTWLGDQSGMMDGKDTLQFDGNLNACLAKDENNEWYCAFGGSASAVDYSTRKSTYKGEGRTGVLNFNIKLAPGKSSVLQIFIAGSFTSKKDLEDTYKELETGVQKLLEAKKDRYQQIARQSKLTTPDSGFDEVFRWLKYNSDWFVRTVPAFGTGIAAGYPDYPWWFGCDSEYALKGYLTTGKFDITKKTIELLSSISEKTNNNGRIVHEVSTNGEVYNKGNVNETPQFASLVWKAYLWTGEEQLLKDYFPQIQRGLHWLLTEKDPDHNLFPEGSGMMEIHGLESEMIDVASYTQRGFEDASKMAELLNDTVLSAEYLDISEKLKEKINRMFWSEEFSSFADFIGTDDETLRLIDDAIIRADTLNKPWAVDELKATRKYLLTHPDKNARPFVLYHNWVVNTPMEMGIADADKAKKALQTARKFINPYGVFVTGIDRDESAGKEEGSFKGSKQFSYTGAVMTLPTGVLSVAENNYGNPDLALDYLTRMGRSFSFALPGSMYEVSPDYGMFAQAWNIYGYGVSVVEHFFGIQPNAAKHEINIAPQMPSEWKEASLENVRVGNNEISVFYKKTNEGLSLKITSKEKDWKINVSPNMSGFGQPNVQVSGDTIIYQFLSQ